MKLEWEPVVFLGLLGSGLGWMTWALFISEFPNASPWRRGRKRFLDSAEELGFDVSRENCTATKDVDGVLLTVGIKVVRDKSNSIVMSAQLPLPEVPSGMMVAQEMSVWGGSRALGAKERTTGDPEFDAVFWLQCDDEEQLRGYLTLPRREALLRWTDQVPTARLTEQGIVAERIFFTPGKMKEATFGPFLSGLEGLVREFQGGEPGEEKPRGSAVGEMQRRFARNTMFIWLFWLLGSVAVPSFDIVTNLIRVSSGLMVLLTFGLYRDVQGSRVLLQGVYAFLSLVSCGVLVLGLLESAELLSWRFLRLEESQVVVFAIIGSLTTLWLWGRRHRLKALDTLRARTRVAGV